MSKNITVLQRWFLKNYQIKIDIEVLAVEYMKGQSWSDKDWAEKIICPTQGCVGFDIPIGISIFEFSLV